MSLTIHYDITSTSSDPKLLIQKMRDLAKTSDLPFDKVFRIRSLGKGEEEYTKKWLTLQSEWGTFVQQDLDNKMIIAKATAGYGFNIEVGAGCDPLSIGLAQHDNNSDAGAPAGWAWQGFCDTSNSFQVGEYYLARCHMAITALLDRIKQLPSVAVSVYDESGFFEHRDYKQLIKIAHMQEREFKSFEQSLRFAGVKVSNSELDLIRARNLNIKDATFNRLNSLVTANQVGI